MLYCAVFLSLMTGPGCKKCLSSQMALRHGTSC
nr:MAG TPA: putative YmpT-like protein [Caudoviricetes sp.]